MCDFNIEKDLLSLTMMVEKRLRASSVMSSGIDTDKAILLLAFFISLRNCPPKTSPPPKRHKSVGVESLSRKLNEELRKMRGKANL